MHIFLMTLAVVQAVQWTSCSNRVHWVCQVNLTAPWCHGVLSLVSFTLDVCKISLSPWMPSISVRSSSLKRRVYPVTQCWPSTLFIYIHGQKTFTIYNVLFFFFKWSTASLFSFYKLPQVIICSTLWWGTCSTEYRKPPTSSCCCKY